MRHFIALSRLVFVVALAAVGVAALPVQAQSGSGSDLVLFGPASNPGGLVGFIQAPEANGTNASEFYPAFLPAAANVPNNVGVQFYEDPSRTVLSDQIWTQAGFWYFASDPNLINFASFGITPVGSLVEDGTPQDVSGFFLLPPGSMAIMSDTDVPEPTGAWLFGLFGAARLLLRRRRG